MELALQVRGNFASLVETAQYCERNEVTAMALPDHYLASKSDPSEPAYDALTQLAGLARETSTLELSTLVSPVTFRHPAVTLKSAVTLDEMSDGRFTLGLGSGWFTEEHELFGIPFPTQRFDLLEEALGYTKAALTGHGFRGEHYQLEAFQMAPTPRNLRIVVGGNGPVRTPTLAGTYADEFNVYCSPIEKMQERISLARQSAEDAGRDPAGLLISTAGVVVTGTTPNGYKAALEAATQRFGKPADELEKSLAESGLPIGLDAKSTINELAEIGVERFYLQMFGTDPERRQDMLAALN